MALVPGVTLSVGSYGWQGTDTDIGSEAVSVGVFGWVLSTEFSANDEGALDYIIANQIEVNTNQDIDFIVGGMIGKRVPSQIN